MKKNIILIVLLMAGLQQSIDAQKYFSKSGEISFYSHTPIEDIEATSNTATTVYDSESGNIQWAVLVKSFEFEKALMQEHFNENYMESSKFPKAAFSGMLVDHEKVNLSKDGTYTTQVSGNLTIHGVKNPIEAQATFVVKDGKATASSTFKVLVADYGIEVPSVVKDNIAKEVTININSDYEILEKS